jgi:hypothetical protein
VQFDITANNVTVDWDDGVIDRYETANDKVISHVYEDNYLHTILISTEGLTRFGDYNYNPIIGSVKELRFGNCPTLEVVSIFNNKLQAVDIRYAQALMVAEFSNNQLTALDVSMNTNLETLCCSENQLTVLNVRENTNLNTLYCFENQLTDLDVSKNTKLWDLNCSGNQLTALDTSNNTKLKTLIQ